MNRIDKIFQDKLKEFEKSPSDRAWEKLNSALEEQEDKKKGFFWYSIAAGLALLIIGTILIVEFKSGEKSISHIPPIKSLERKSMLASSKPIKPEIPLVLEKISIPAPKLKSWSQEEPLKPLEDKGVSENEVLLARESKSIDSLNKEVKEIDFKEESVAIALNEESNSSYHSQAISVVIKRGHSSITPLKESEKNTFKNSKIARVATQVLNIKNGEKVDLDEFSDLLAFNKKGKTTQNK